MAKKSAFWARLQRDYVRAGDAYYEQGKLSQAAEMYRRGGSLRQAAEVYTRLGDLDAAVEAYSEAGEDRKAGQLLASHGKLQEAVSYLEEGGAFWEAAEVAVKLKQFSRAGRLFERVDSWEKAVRCYEQAGDFEDALRVISAEVDRLEAESGEGIQGAGSIEATRVATTWKAELLVRVGRARDAGKLHLQHDRPEAAGPLFEQAGQYERAVRAYLDANLARKALPLLSKAIGLDPKTQAQVYFACGEYDKAAENFRDAAAEHGLDPHEEAALKAEAANAFEQAKQLDQAASLWRELENWDRAADLYFRIERWREAGACYEKGRKWKQAAESYAAAGEAKKAALCYERSKDTLRAAEQWYQAGDVNRAADALQGLEVDDPEFNQGSLLLAELLIELGNYHGAEHRLEMIDDHEDHFTGTMRVDRLYWQARALEGRGEREKALSNYQRVSSMKRTHRDVVERLQTLQQRQRPESRRYRKGDVLKSRYRVLDELGHGGMSRVYRVFDMELDEEVAIKVLRANDEDGVAEDRLRAEVRITRRITHPNVVRVFDVSRFEDGLLISMELVRGQTLEKVIRGPERLPLPKVKDYLRQILLGLTAAHDLKVVHRDLKPGNVMLEGDVIKLLDFGIARAEETDVRLTQAGQLLGSPHYMSPEQLRGKELDARSDLYALGVLTFTMLTGSEPFHGDKPAVIAVKHLDESPPDLRKLRPELMMWPGFVAQLLHKDRDHRYGSAAEVLQDLADLPVE